MPRPAQFLAMAAMAWLGSASAPSQSLPTAFVNVTVVPMDRDGYLTGHTVVIRDGRIAEVGPASRVRVPRGTRVIDGRGRYLMPGLVDTHVHVNRASDLLLYLANGVTTVRNMKGEPKDLVWRERIRAGQMAGPTLLTAGPFIEGVFSAADAERIAREQVESGYDFLKVHGDLSLEAYRRLIAVGGALGVMVVGHLPRNLPFDSVMAMPQASIDHAEEYVYTVFGNRVGDTTRLREVARLTRTAGVTVAPTLVAYEHIARQLDSLPVLLAQPEARFLPPIERLRWRAENNYYSRNIPATAARGFRASLRFQVALVRALHSAGVPLMLGTDAGGPETIVPGFSALHEIELLATAGLSPYEALRTATANPAVAWNAAQEFGTIVSGARADLLLLEADPLRDPTNVRRRVGVMARGDWIPEADLTDRLSRIAAKYRTEEGAVDSLRHAGLDAAIAARQSSWLAGLDRDAQRFVDYQIAEMYRDVLEAGGESALRTAFRRGGSLQSLVPPFAQDAMTDLGYRYLWAKRPALASAILRLVAEAYPAEYGAYAALGEALLIEGDSTGARAALERALTLKPSDGLAQTLMRQLIEPRPPQ